MATVTCPNHLIQYDDMGHNSPCPMCYTNAALQNQLLAPNQSALANKLLQGGASGGYVTWICVGGGGVGSGGFGGVVGATGSAGYSFGGTGGGLAPPRDRHTLRRVKYLPNTLGWRYWCMGQDGCLVSPQQHTRWEDGELRTQIWNKDDVVRGVAGIHALLAPEHWRLLDFPQGGGLGTDVTGLVERFGNYILGEDGWRAEWVVVRELLAPTHEIATKLRAYYPDLPVHCDEEPQQEIDHGYRKGHRDRAEGSPDIPASADDGADAAQYGTTFAQLANAAQQRAGAGGGIVANFKPRMWYPVQATAPLDHLTQRIERNIKRARLLIFASSGLILIQIARAIAHVLAQ